MRRWTKRSAVVLATVVTICAVVVAARAVTGSSGSDPNSASGKNEVVSIVTQDGKSESKTGFSMKHISQDTVDNVNAAAATSSGCSDCQSIAVAVQIVLITGDPSTVAPKNYAIAINTNCLRCASMGLAYQDVITTGGNVYFTSEANNEFSSLEQQIRDVADSGGSFVDMRSQIDGLVHQMWSIASTEMQHSGQSYKADPQKDVQVNRTGADGCPTSASSPSPSDASPTDASSTPSPVSATPCPSPATSETPAVDGSPTPVPDCTEQPAASPTPDPTPTAVEPSPCPTQGETPAPTDSVTPDATTTDQPSPAPTTTPVDTTTPDPSPTATG